jgi:hypothetical protein
MDAKQIRTFRPGLLFRIANQKSEMMDKWASRDSSKPKSSHAT